MDNLPATLPEVEAALAEIPVGSPAYWRDEGMQGRYRQFLTRKGELEAAKEPDEPDEDMFAIPAGADMNVARAAGDILMGTPESERRDLFDSFGALHEDVRAFIGAELANTRTPPSFAFTDEDKAEIRGTPAAKILAAEWGEGFWRKLSIAEGRIARLFAEFDTYERGERAVEMVTDWLLGLPAASLASIYRKLAA